MSTTPDTKTIDYTSALYADICDTMADYLMTGWTVCGAEDPAVIALGPEFAHKHPEFKGFTVVRVIDVYVNPSKSDTRLEFSTRETTDEEYALYEETIED